MRLYGRAAFSQERQLGIWGSVSGRVWTAAAAQVGLLAFGDPGRVHTETSFQIWVG